MAMKAVQEGVDDRGGKRARNGWQACQKQLTVARQKSERDPMSSGQRWAGVGEHCFYESCELLGIDVKRQAVGRRERASERGLCCHCWCCDDATAAAGARRVEGEHSPRRHDCEEQQAVGWTPCDRQR